MKRYLLMLMMAAGITQFANAQKVPPTAVELTDKNIEALDKKVKLNPTQRGIIYNYTLEMYKEQVAIGKKQQAGTFQEEDIARFYKTQNQTSKNIRNILKGEQQTQFDEFQEEQLRGGDKKKKKKKRAKDEEEDVVTGISGLTLPQKE